MVLVSFLHPLFPASISVYNSLFLCKKNYKIIMSKKILLEENVEIKVCETSVSTLVVPLL